MVQHKIPSRDRDHTRNRLIFDRDGDVSQWVADQLPHVTSFGPHTAIGIERAGVLIGGVVYHDYTLSDIQISMATINPRWAEPGVIASCLGHYPFIQMKVRRVTCIVPLSLERVHKFLRHLGFIEEGRHRYGFDKTTAVTFGMVREECRWLPLDQREQF